MTELELQAVVRGIAPVIRDYFDLSTKALLTKNAELETQNLALTQRVAVLEENWRHWFALEAQIAQLQALAPVPGPPGERGEKGDPGDVGPKGEPGEKGADAALPDIEAIAKLAAELVPVPKDGRDGTSVTVDDVAPLICDEVAKAMLAVPIPKDGAPGLKGDPGERGEKGMDAEPPDLEAIAQRAAALIPVPKDGAPGQSVDEAALKVWLLDEVVDAVASIKVPKDGTSVTVDDVAPLIREEVAKAVESQHLSDTLAAVDQRMGTLETRAAIPGPPGRDGAEGPMGPVGPMGPAGRDGQPGVPGRDGERGEKGDPGRDGIDGRDAVMGHIKMAREDERTMRFVWMDGTPVEGGTVTFATPLDRGVYKDGQAYLAGDGVSFGGSFFIAQRDTEPGEKPENGSGAWRLAVKRGRDGKDGPQGPRGEKGEPGKMGPAGRDYR